MAKKLSNKKIWFILTTHCKKLLTVVIVCGRKGFLEASFPGFKLAQNKSIIVRKIYLNISTLSAFDVVPSFE
jgi:hypothetical protein